MDTDPPLQIGPVAPNHCRIGYHILQAVYASLNQLEEGESVPEEIDIQVFEDGESARVGLPMLPGPDPWGEPDPDETEEDDDEVLFLTVVPPGADAAAVDQWIVPLAEALGLEPDPAIAEGGYQEAMRQAKEQTQAALTSVRQRFMERGLLNIGGPRFGFKIGLPADDEGTEWVWIQPKAWDQPDKMRATLESEPVAVPGYKLGQKLDVATADIADYLIYHPRTGEREGGFTDRIAADYGLYLPE